MKKRILITALVSILVLAFSVSAHAITVDQTATVAATATVGGVTTFSVVPPNIVYGSTADDAFDVLRNTPGRSPFRPSRLAEG